MGNGALMLYHITVSLTPISVSLLTKDTCLTSGHDYSNYRLELNSIVMRFFEKFPIFDRYP